MKKGVSPLVAAVLLIAVTMTIAALLSYWASGFIQQRTREWEEESPGGACTFAGFKIYSCIYSGTDSSFRVILENLRDVELKNITAFVIYNNGTIGSQSGFSSLPGGQIQTYTISDIDPDFQDLTIKTHCPDVRQTDDCR